jgi:hypothetical protein
MAIIPEASFVPTKNRPLALETLMPMADSKTIATGILDDPLGVSRRAGAVLPKADGRGQFVEKKRDLSNGGRGNGGNVQLNTKWRWKILLK